MLGERRRHGRDQRLEVGGLGKIEGDLGRHVGRQAARLEPAAACCLGLEQDEKAPEARTLLARAHAGLPDGLGRRTFTCLSPLGRYRRALFRPHDAHGRRLMKLLAGNSNRPLAEAIAASLRVDLTKATVHRFADMEVFVEIHENVRGEDVFVIQSTSYPANDNLMELLVIIDALKRASARRITAVIPYFGYARQDRKPGPRTPISAKLVANLITEAGADRVLTMELHAGQIQGFFDIPVDNLYSAPLMVPDILSNVGSNHLMVDLARCRRRHPGPRVRQAP